MDISLTKFTDFALAQGTGKVTCVRDTKEIDENDYVPERDFYRPLRTEMLSILKDGRSPSDLKQILNTITDRKKLANYPVRIDGFKKFYGRKTIEWRGKPPVRSWFNGELEVRVNPEARLRINGHVYIVKLYFKADPVSKRRIDVIHHMLDSTKVGTSRAKAAVLDVARGKLFEQTRPVPNVEVMLRGEAASFVSIWKQL